MPEEASRGIVVEMLADIQGLLSGMAESTSAVTAATAEMEGALEGLEAVATAVMGPFILLAGLLAGGHMFGEAITKTVDLAVQLDVMRQKTGMAVEELSRLKYAAELSHVSVETLTIGLQRLARGMEAAGKGGASPAGEAFKALGVAATTSSGELRPMHDVLIDLAERFRTMPDGAEKTALAMDLFGRSGANLIPLLNRGRDGIAELEAEAEKMGATMSGQDVQAALEYEEAMKRLHSVWNGFVRNIVIAALPVLEKLVQTFSALVHSVTAAFHILMATAAFMSGDFANAAIETTAAWESLKKVVDDFTLRTPAQSVGEGGNAPIPGKDNGPDLLQRYQLELDKLKVANADNVDGLEQIELDFWKEKLATVAEGSKEYIEIYSKIADLTVAIERRKAEAAKKAAHDAAEEQKRVLKEITDQWMAVFNSIPNAFQQTFNSMKQTGGTFGQFMRQVFQRLALDAISAEASMLAAHAAAWLARKGITAQGVLTTVALEAWGALKVVAMKAAEAAAGAWAAIVGIPYIGPFLAPAAALAALAGVLALGNGIRSASGGFDIPAGLNPITQLHAQEMVLPAEYANVIRGLAGGGGAAGGGGVFHIHAMDAASFQAWARSNKNTFADTVVAAAGAGRRTGREQMGRGA